MSELHRVERGRSEAACCSRHTAAFARCSCGWSTITRKDGKPTPRTDVDAAIMGHRLATLEAAAGIAFKFLSAGARPEEKP